MCREIESTCKGSGWECVFRERERESERERWMERVYREREGECFEIEGVCREIESVYKGSVC